MDKRIWCVALMMVGSVSLLGCGKKTDTSVPDAGGSGTGGTPATAGTGGGGGSKPTMIGNGGSTVVMNTPCGSTKCAGIAPNSNMMMIPGFTLAATCCADQANAICGSVNSTTMACEAPPDPAPKCPKAFGMSGCCSGMDLCGVDLSLGGMGCVELSKFKAMVPPMFQNFLMLGNPTHCSDGSLVPVPDAGTTKPENDAGN